MTDSLNIDLNAAQRIFLFGLNKKFRAFVSGFGGGKTWVGCLDLLLFASTHPRTVQGYFAPTYPQIRDIFYPSIEESGYTLGFKTRVHLSNKEVSLYRNGSYYGKIICRSMDNPGSIQGFKIARALVDELDTLRKDQALKAWHRIISRMRLVIHGVENGIGVTTTPEGFGFIYDTFYNRKDDSKYYGMVQGSTFLNQKYLPPDYIQSMLDTYPDDLAQAYLYGKFVNLENGNVYHYFKRDIHHSNREIQKTDQYLYIGLDFNIGGCCAVVFLIEAGNPIAVDEFVSRDTWDICNNIAFRYPGKTITITPDASGSANRTNSSQSDIEILQAAGYYIDCPKVNPAIRDRINAVNALLSHDRLKINTNKCPNLTNAFETQGYDKNGEPEKFNMHPSVDDWTDSAGYFLDNRYKIQRPETKIARYWK